MKELSVQEKAIAYDEAIKRAKDMLSYKEVRRENMEYLFPELKESEDKRIRKALVDWFSKNHASDDFYGIAWDRVVTWLEKQGEQKIVIIPKFRVGDTIKNKKTKDAVKINGVDLQNQAYYYQGWDGAATIHSDFRISEQDDWELVEQKPAWSEEDERVIHCLEYTVKHFYEDEDTINWCCNWLKSLKDRVQPKQEWSEEDEKHLKGISLCLSSIDNLEDPETWINWFKNLKDRVQSKPKQWKPTEMQLTCLEDAINAYHRDGHPAKCLTSLLNDLKAL